MKTLLHLTRAAFAAAILLASGSCSDEPDNGPKPATTIENIELTSSNLTKNGVNMTCTPSVDHLAYYPVLMEKSEFDQFTTNDACIQHHLDNFREAAQGDAKVLSELIARVTKKGKQVLAYRDLTADTEYVFYAFGLTQKGIATSILFKLPFTTPAPGPSQNELAIAVSNIGADGALVDVTTTNGEPYIFAVRTVSELNAMTDEQIMDKVLDCFPDPDLGEAYTSRGNDSFNMQARLEPGTDYFALAFGYEAGVKTTELVRQSFTTAPGGWKENAFTITQESLTSRKAGYKVTPTDPLAPYFITLIPASEIADGSDATALIKLRAVLAARLGEGRKYHELLSYGETSHTFNDLTPETDYYLCCAGINPKGEVISTLVKQSVRTSEVSTAAVTFGKPVIEKRKVTIKIVPNDNTVEWKVIVMDEKFAFHTEEFMTVFLLNSDTAKNLTALTHEVPANKKAAYFYTIGFDASGNPGKLTSLEVPIK